MWALGRAESIRRVRSKLLLLASLMAVGSLVAEHGFFLSESELHYVHVIDLVIVSLFLLDTLLLVISAPSLKKALRKALFPLLIAGLFALQMLVLRFIFAGRPSALPSLLEFLKLPSLTKLYFIVLQGYILSSLLFYTQKVSRRLASAGFRPDRIIVTAFLLMILAGTGLLLLPRSTPASRPLSFVDALFTSTSAVCVTGLTVVDTASAFTRTGQSVILLLMQIGGLGIMTFAAFFALLSRRGLGIRERVVYGEVMNVEIMAQISRLVVFILALTLVVEAVGAVMFFFLFPGDGGLARVFEAVFHSVSGFCNAGFTIFDRGFMDFAHHWAPCLVMMFLIVAGGLGFIVHRDLLSSLTVRAGARKRPVKLKLQTKVTLLLTAMLLVGGATAFYLLEGGKVSFLQALFQSVTARTAGFSTVQQEELGSASHLLTLVLMFIGAAPGSTAGGIKLTTLAVFLATVWGMLRGRSRTEMFRKTIPEETVREAVVVFGLSVFAVVLSFTILLVWERAAFDVLLFETVSAFGTVGLSLGVTKHLSTLGKSIIILTMLFGRIGPMTIALAVSGKIREKGYAYPMERVMVG